ncbi:probable pectinesterase/pectinesterase inhibitor 61 [Phtheirospermum japonicum]|uniref:Pectinesterase n=1 Tax=Phtheirospermum japonicum TaxID=374723 RepID=A0A830C2E1_9LAMI|nr:probable pectinesterase/pectinesterase inhibitor 61 [Phtheirospermum japonicum]
MTSPNLRGNMEYGRLGKPDPAGSSTRSLTTEPAPNPKRSKLKLLLILAAVLMAACGVSAAIAVVIRRRGGGPGLHSRRPSQAMSRACSRTRYPALCVDSLLEFPGATAASEKELVHISVNVTLQKVGRALNFATDFTYLNMDPLVRSAHSDCLELLEDAVDLLSRSLTAVAPGGEPDGPTQDVLTWLSAALTNQDTCAGSLEEAKNQGGGDVERKMWDRLKDLSELLSNSLTMYAASSGGDFAGVPIQGPGRRLMSGGEKRQPGFPVWMTRRERVLLDTPAAGINADVIVSKSGGNGTVKTIAEAIKKAPEKSDKRFIIHVRAGRYEENELKLGKKKTNIMLIGDGKGKTVITGGKSVEDKLTTFRTASFAATGDGFIAKDITFENYAGPSKHQAVALRVGADRAVIYQCSIVGYQDTLYAHSKKQFYRDCDIYGTVDFIFGNAAVVFQNCAIHARKPMPQQKNTITAQHRMDPNQNTGISIHACQIVADPDLEAAKGAFPTYLGRPWKAYARTVYMLSNLGDHIHPAGWLEWNGNYALDTLYYGEYMNSGPGAGLGQRVKWKGYHAITSVEEASKFTVERFIFGSSWLPPTGVPHMSGLSN